MGNILFLIFKNPLTSSVGMGLILANLGTIIHDFGTGQSLWAIIQSPAGVALMAGLQGLLAKDFNVTGGTKQQ